MDTYKGIALAYVAVAAVDFYLALTAAGTIAPFLFSILAVYFLFRARQMWVQS